MTAIIAMIESASVIILAVMFLAFVGDRLQDSAWLKGLVFGLVFAATGVMAMSTPVELVPGVRVDPRNAVMALSAGIGGPVSAVITCAALSATRLYFGGGGAVAGTLSIWGVAIASTALWYWWTRWLARPIGYRYILLHAFSASLVPAVVIYIFRANTDFIVFLKAISLFVPTNFVAVILLGALVVRDQQRRWAIMAHAESQAQLHGIANNAPGVLFQMTLDDGGRARFCYVSNGAERVLGVSPERILADAGTIGRMVSEQAMSEMRTLLRSSAKTFRSWVFETECVRPDGRVIWIRAAAEPRVDARGLLVWDGSLSDITDQKHSEQMKNDFISTVSHELRTPLTSIRGSLGLVAGGAAGEIGPKASSLVKIAHSNSERLVRLINDILDIEKIESGRMPFDLRSTALRPLAEAAIEASRGYLANRGVEISLVDDAPGLSARVDADRLHQVMTNLLSNAIKFSPEHGEIIVRIERHAGLARISVSDTGAGIPVQFQPRIFDKFEQADTTDRREKGGTGLGLSIAKAIVEHMHGTIGFETEAGRGTMFHFDIPEVEQVLPPEVEPEGTAAGGRVLVCEDEPDIARIIELILAEEGIACDIAPDLATARRLLDATRYVAVTLDIRLGMESGLELFRELRLSPLTKDLPVIVVSAYIDEARRTLNGSALGIVDWLEKPVDQRHLRETMVRALHPRADGKPSLLHVEDDEGILEVISQTVGDLAATSFARSVGEARQMLAASHFDVVILDLELPDGSGAELLGEIPRDTAVIIFSAEEVEQRFAASVAAALTKTRTSELEIAAIVRKLVQTGRPNGFPPKTPGA